MDLGKARDVFKIMRSEASARDLYMQMITLVREAYSVPGFKHSHREIFISHLHKAIQEINAECDQKIIDI